MSSNNANIYGSKSANYEELKIIGTGNFCYLRLWQMREKKSCIMDAFLCDLKKFIRLTINKQMNTVRICL